MRQEKDPELSKTRREAGNRAFQVNHDQRQRDTQAGTFKEVIEPNVIQIWQSGMGMGGTGCQIRKNSATLHLKWGRVIGYLSFLRELGQSRPTAGKA